jgi:hypothetical protein
MMETAKKRVYQRGRSCRPSRTDFTDEAQKSLRFLMPAVADLLHNQEAYSQVSVLGGHTGAHMKRFNFGLGIVIAALTLAAAPAFAQKPESGSSGGPQAGGGAVDRSTGGGAPSSGGAVDRGSGGGGGVVSSSSAGSSGSVSSSSGGSDLGSSSANAMSSPSLGFSSRSVRESAPEHRPGFGARMGYAEDGQRATPRSSGPSGGSGGGTAVTRGGGSSGGGSSSGASSSTSGGARSGSGDSSPSRTTGRMRTAPAPEHNAENSNNTTGAREVPTWSRPRGDRPATGTAVDRTVPVRDPNNGGFYNGYYGYYNPYYGYGYPVYGYNGYYIPYGFGMGYGLYSGFGWSPYYGDPFGDPYGYGGGGGAYSSSYGRGEQGNLKLKVKPRSAKVYVDGYFVGYVDQFDGAFQKLALNTGRHKVEVKADGFETAEFDVLINPEQTVTFQGELKRIQ